MRRTTHRTKRRHAPRSHSAATPPAKAPFIVHFRELRRRLFFVLITIGAGAAFACTIQTQLTAWLLEPAGSQQFIYTTPGGGFDFQFKLCLFTGLALGIPVIMYHLGQYLRPLLRKESKGFVRNLMTASSVLALIGICFGYFIGLPAAMHFLLQSLSTDRISALITIQSYLSFIVVYLLGSALLFQIPLVMILINRLKPLQPRKLFFDQKWFLISAFVAGAVISPTPDIRNQLMLTAPLIVTYEISIALIWFINRRQKSSNRMTELLKKDEQIQIERLASFNKAHEAWRRSVQVKNLPQATQAVTTLPLPSISHSAKTAVSGNTTVQKVKPHPDMAATRPTRARISVRTSSIIHPNNYIQDFSRRRAALSRPTPQPQAE